LDRAAIYFTVKAIRAWIKIRLDDGSRALFPSQKGGVLSREQVHRIFKGIAERAGIPKGKRFVHILKHSRARHLVDASLALINPCGLGSIRLARMHSGIDVQGFTWASIEIEAGKCGKT
jgi:Phage integrase family